MWATSCVPPLCHPSKIIQQPSHALLQCKSTNLMDQKWCFHFGHCFFSFPNTKNWGISLVWACTYSFAARWISWEQDEEVIQFKNPKSVHRDQGLVSFSVSLVIWTVQIFLPAQDTTNFYCLSWRNSIPQHSWEPWYDFFFCSNASVENEGRT